MLPIATARLLVRRMAPADLQDFLRFNTHPANLEFQAIVPFTEETGLAYLERQATFDPDSEDGGWLGLAVELPHEGLVIGEVGIYLPKQPRTKGDIGWTFHPDYHGRGYATEAARALLTYAFEGLQLHRVTAGCNTSNTASLRLMERLGMRREGHYIQSTLLHGTWRDECSYALLREEWQAQKNQD